MIELPASTEFVKKIPKQKFYDRARISHALRRLFVNDIDSIIWRNKLSSGTCNVEQGNNVTEIQVLHIVLKSKSFSMPILEIIERTIQYHIVFLLEYETEFKLAISYKPVGGSQKWYSGQWLPFENLDLHICGLNLDDIYENFVRQIAGPTLSDDCSLDVSVNIETEKNKLIKRIASLENKMRREKQFNRQVELNRQIRSAKAELAALNS